MICHATDPNAHETGSPRPGQVKPGNERACLGSLHFVKREVNALNAVASTIPAAGVTRVYLAEARAAGRRPLTREGILAWYRTTVLSGTPLVTIKLLEPNPNADWSLPWENKA